MSEQKKPYAFRKVSKLRKFIKHSFPKSWIGKYCIIIPLKIETKKEWNTIKSACKIATEYCQFGFLNKQCRVYTNGFTEHIKPLIPLIKKKVLQDCINNPRKYLDKTPKHSHSASIPKVKQR